METDCLRHCKETKIGYLIPYIWKGFAQNISCHVAVCINAVPKAAQITRTRTVYIMEAGINICCGQAFFSP